MFLVYNSDTLSENEFHLPVNDRAFQYGDGLFETIRYESGQLWFWPDHMDRLTGGMAALQLKEPEGFTAEKLQEDVHQLLSVNQLVNQPARVKIQVWRQPGGYYTPATHAANVLITAYAGRPFAITENDRVEIYDAFRVTHSPVSAYKTLNALPYVLAGLFKQQHDVNDVILLDREGHVAECLASNLFWYTGRTLFTPSLQTGCVNGIIRRQLLRLAPQAGLVVREGCYMPEVLDQAEAIFCANAMGIQWVNQLTNATSGSLIIASDARALLNGLFAQLLG